MGFASTATSVIVAVIIGLAKLPTAVPQAPSALTDPDAYAIYAVLLPTAWKAVSKDVLVLQQETEAPRGCGDPHVAEPGWTAVEKNLAQENAVVRVLRPVLRLDIPYLLVPRAEILADDARLALKYPGMWQRRPGAMEYAAVSAVGFNKARTKAKVYVRLRSSGNTHAMELREGRWVQAVGAGVCGWIA
jgi:hypothetical protein